MGTVKGFRCAKCGATSPAGRREFDCDRCRPCPTEVGGLTEARWVRLGLPEPRPLSPIPPHRYLINSFHTHEVSVAAGTIPAVRGLVLPESWVVSRMPELFIASHTFEDIRRAVAGQ